MLYGLEAGLTIEQCCEYTPYMISLHCEALANRRRHMQELAAWHACFTVNPHIKHKVQPRQILPPRRGTIDASHFDTIEDFQKAAADMSEAENDTDSEE